MNRRKFIGNLLKGSAGAVATVVLGDTIIDAITPEKKQPLFLRCDGTWAPMPSNYIVSHDPATETSKVFYKPDNIPVVKLKLTEVTIQSKVIKLKPKNYRYAL